MGLSVETLVLAKKYTDEQIRNSGGGADSADLAALKEYIDLPFEESFSDTLTLDGDSTGLTLYSSYYKILDIEITEEDLANGGSYSLFNLSNETTQIWTFTIDDITPYLENPSILAIKGGTIIVVIEDNNFLGVDFTKGIYVDKLFYGDTALVSRITSLTINGFNKFSSRVLKDSYLPEIEVSWNDLNDKPFYDTGEYDFIPVFENNSFNRISPYVYFGDNLNIQFVLGAVYKVVFNGVDYICEAKKEGKYVYIGNPVGYIEKFSDIFMTDFSTLDWETGEPFCIFNGMMTVKDASSEPKASLYKRKSIVNMLERKYIDYIPGENTSLKTIILDDTEYICGDGSEIFNDYINNKALGKYSHAEGFNTIASGNYSHAEAYGTVAEELYSHAEGMQTKAIGVGSHAEGNNVEAKGSDSHAEGQSTVALGTTSHAEGADTIAIGAASHVQGRYNLIDDSVPRYTEVTVSSLDWPEYDGEKIVYLLNQKPEFNNQTGQFTITNEITEISYKNLQKDNLFLFVRPENNTITGYYTIIDFVSSREDGDITLYKYNYRQCIGFEESGGRDAKLAHIVGNGVSEEKRSNAHTLDWDGNAWFAGDVYVGSTSGVNRDEGSKKLVTESDLNNRVTPTALMLADINTGIQYKIQVVDGKLTMTEVAV